MRLKTWDLIAGVATGISINRLYILKADSTAITFFFLVIILC